MIGTLKDLWEDMQSGVYDFTENGKCIGCGQCCTNFLPLSSKDIKEIRRYIKKKHIKEQVHRPPMVIDFDVTCPFRSDDEKKCLIYPVRPAICKSFVCNLPSKDIDNNKETLRGRFQVYDMRELFYGDNDIR